MPAAQGERVGVMQIQAGHPAGRRAQAGVGVRLGRVDRHHDAVGYEHTWKPEGGGGILFGSRSFDMFLLNIAILLSGLVIYLVARWVQRRRGVDLDAAYREIPIE